MRVCWLQHVPFEGLGSMEPWLRGRGARLARTRPYAGEALPGPDEFDWLIAMGGPMSVNDEGAHPWLAAEKSCIARAIEARRPVLGVCLGAQLIASALGAPVRRNPEPEIGWFPIEPAAGAREDPFGAVLADAGEAFHWHGDTFEPPPGARRLARSEACAEQAFSIGDRVLALQFHLETTEASARALIEHCRDELGPARFVQDEAHMLAEAARFERANRTMARLLALLEP